jgi:hypothetical protein
MIRRFRLATVLIALITLFAYAAESAAALVFCESAGAPSQMMDSGEADAHADHGGGAPGTGESGASHEQQCPIGMTGSGSCAVASLPAGLPDVQGVPVTSDRDWIAVVGILAAGPVHPMFHPPRA